jgi:alkylhydroperoxidase/carboxymuconolactone decarboxylase family protein YurZ
VFVEDALAFFERVYGEVPEWVRTMHEQRPEALNDYLELRRTVMEKGALSHKEKEWILVGVNAARRYERSMLYHTRGAVDAGSTVPELAEILLPCILSRGLPAWLEGYKALTYAEQYLNQRGHDRDEREEVSEATAPSITTVEEALTYFSREAAGDQPEWVGLMNVYAPGTLRDYANLRKRTLGDGLVPRKMKELVLVGINLSERYPNGVSLHVSSARRLGATDAELADVALTCVLTAGIPAWFELSDLLIADQESK